MGHTWDWEAEPGTLDAVDFPAPTCATCHISGFGPTSTSHDVGDRLTWFLAAPISARRPVWQENKTRMQGVCGECHNQNFLDEFYADGDALVEAVNSLVIESDELFAILKDNGLATAAPFDQPVDFVYYELWHHWGRTAKFGGWMQGPDYTQWHGAYEMLKERTELIHIINEEMEAAGLEPIEYTPPPTSDQ